MAKHSFSEVQILVRMQGSETFWCWWIFIVIKNPRGGPNSENDPSMFEHFELSNHYTSMVSGLDVFSKHMR